MTDLRTILDERSLRALRAAWDPAVCAALLSAAIERSYPPFAAWNGVLDTTFYATSSPLRQVDRERCLIAVLTASGPAPSLALHIYVGLMEGVEAAEICQIMGLAANYAGVQRLSEALPALRRTLELLRRLAAETVQPSDIIPALLEEFRVTR